MTAENYWHDLRDASLYGDGATLGKPDIPAKPKLYLADQGHYVAGLRNIPFPLQAGNPVRNWRPEMEDDVSTGYDYEAGILCWNPKMIWFHTARSEGFFATDAERLDMCLSDTYFMEDVARIPREPTQPVPPRSNPGEENQSDVEESSEASSSEAGKEKSEAEQSKDSDDNGNQSGDEGGNGGDPADMLNADHLRPGKNLPEIADGNANEVEQNPSQETADDAAHAPANQASLGTATSQVGTQPLSAPDPLESLQPTASQHSQQEATQEQAKSNAEEQVQVRLPRALRESITDLDDSDVQVRRLESEEVLKRAKAEKEKREREETRKKEELQKDIRAKEKKLKE